jgi:hypothetical protein
MGPSRCEPPPLGDGSKVSLMKGQRGRETASGSLGVRERGREGEDREE